MIYARQRERVDYFLTSIINNNADKSQCLPSCKRVRKVLQRLKTYPKTVVVICSYQTSNVAFDSRDDRYGLFVTFDQEVLENRSQLSIGKRIIMIVWKIITEIITKGNLTLLTRIGGIIGVGKEFLWIMITLLSFLLKFKSKLMNLTEQ